MNPIIKPPKLKPGDTVGIASPAASWFPTLETFFQRGVAYLQRLGLHVRIAKHALRQCDHLNILAQQRADDLNTLFADPEIQAILCLSGGSGTNALLPLLDWATVERHPKIVMGYSAVTALLVGIHTRTNLVTFHGPILLDGFSEFPELFPYTRQQVERVLFTAEPVGVLKPPLAWTTDFPHEDRPRQMQPNPGWRWRRPGKARGRLIGGNLHALLTVVGTPYWPSFREKILFVEEVKMGNTVFRWIDESLAHLTMLGLFEEISGVVVSKINDLSEEEEHLFEQLILEYTTSYKFPILTQVDVGHTDPRLILPMGVHASLDSDQDLFCVEEAAVNER
jgi:muramoyltetrapeptide carboxypeptidase LdcA involved in peptidoglycan recycling